jgi:hypothetical protein
VNHQGIELRVELTLEWSISTVCRIVQFLIASIVRYSMPDRFKPPCNPNLRDYGSVLRVKEVEDGLKLTLWLCTAGLE